MMPPDRHPTAGRSAATAATGKRSACCHTAQKRGGAHHSRPITSLRPFEAQGSLPHGAWGGGKRNTAAKPPPNSRGKTTRSTSTALGGREQNTAAR